MGATDDTGPKDQPATAAERDIRVYDGEGDRLLSTTQFSDRITIFPQRSSISDSRGRVRIMWGQDMLRDMLDGRYRTVICGVNDADNSHGIIAQLVDLTSTSQWTARTVSSYARVFQEAVSVHAAADREPYVLKYDLDSVLVLGLLRPAGRDHFTLDDLGRGFATVAKMLRNRHDRRPVASVSFLGARSNRLIDAATGEEPSFESVLRVMFDSGFRGDVYPPPQLWRVHDAGVFSSYPFPPSLDTMRDGGF
ncbi:MAG: hypothetical protein ACF8QF_04955 [Phycisphaerales bacterium]